MIHPVYSAVLYTRIIGSTVGCVWAGTGCELPRCGSGCEDQILPICVKWGGWVYLYKGHLHQTSWLELTTAFKFLWRCEYRVAFVSGGSDTRDLDPKWYRQHIGFVSQEPVLFACSIADNISYGRSDASKEEVSLSNYWVVQFHSLNAWQQSLLYDMHLIILYTCVTDWGGSKASQCSRVHYIIWGTHNYYYTLQK